MINRIITANDYCKREGAKNVRDRIKRHVGQLYRKYKGVNIVCDTEHPVSDAPVFARIYRGAWIADCECRGAEFVSPDEPIFYCLSCYNRRHAGRVRPVVFPDNRAEIERLVLEVPVEELYGFDEASIAEHSQPVIFDEAKPLGYVRSWNPGEDVNEVKRQLAPVREWKKRQGK